jgi:serine protease Do
MGFKAFLALFAVMLVFSPQADQAADRSSPAGVGARQFVVLCYDANRDIVLRVLASECSGTVISEDEARKVQERADERTARALRFDSHGRGVGPRLISIGTAFYVDPRGLLVTNNHVVRGCTTVTLRSNGTQEANAKVAAVDATRDLALLETTSPAPAIAVFEASSAVTAPVTIVGFPDQGLAPLVPLLTAGRLLQDDKVAAPIAHLVIKADVRPGNSGGPVLDQYGRVLGIVSAKLDSVRLYRATHRTVTDIGIGIGLPSLLDFLSRHNVAFRTAKAGDALTPNEILVHALAT